MIALDLQFKTELFAELRKLGISPANDQLAKKWLKSAEVRKLLNISAGTLQNLRINGTIAYTKVGSLLYYKQEDRLKPFDGNSINNKLLKLSSLVEQFLHKAASELGLLLSFGLSIL